MKDDRMGAPPVELLSDVAWARVERGLWSRMDAAPSAEREPARRRWLWIAAPLVAATAIVFLVTRSGSDDRSPPSPPDTADVRVVAPATAATTATFDDAHIELSPASAIVMRRDRPATILERGAAWFSVAPRVDRPAFTVLAGDTTVRVLGTRFRVARSDERVTVEVDHGRVEVQFRDRILILGARQTWSSDVPERVDMLVQTVELPPAAPTPIVPPAAKPKLDKPKLQPTLEPGTPELATPKASKPPVVERDPDQVAFEQLAIVEKQDPQAAIAGYLAISKHDTRWAANALFAAGRLAADRNDPRAETLLMGYLKQFPSHANADDARALLRHLIK